MSDLHISFLLGNVEIGSETQGIVTTMNYIHTSTSKRHFDAVHCTNLVFV